MKEKDCDRIVKPMDIRLSALLFLPIVCFFLLSSENKTKKYWNVSFLFIILHSDDIEWWFECF